MGQVENLRRLVLSGKKENLEMVRQLVLSPRLHKARGVLLFCNIRIEPPVPDSGEGLFAFISRVGKAHACKNQPRRRCIDCNELMCPQHLTDEGKCHVCIGSEDYHAIFAKSTLTEGDFIRLANAFRNAGA